ncbi:MAG: CFI-box-CTERM domain-containing protein [Deltaproteobacteria bacterium]
MRDDYDCDCDHDCDVTVETGSSSSGGSSGGCFIATAAYGSYSEAHVMILRKFRDDVLTKSAIGRGFIGFYYKTSPPVASFIESREFAKRVVRTILKPIAYLVNPASGWKRL